MGFDWDKYQSSGGSFISAAEKKVLAENGIPFKVTSIRQVHKFDKMNFELTIDVPDPETGDPEERVLSFGIGSGVESRDSMLAGMEKHLADGGEAVEAKLEQVGRSWVLRPA